MGAEVVLAAVGLWLIVIAVIAMLVGKVLHWGTSDDALPPRRRLSVDELLAEMDWQWRPRGVARVVSNGEVRHESPR